MDRAYGATRVTNSQFAYAIDESCWFRSNLVDEKYLSINFAVRDIGLHYILDCELLQYLPAK